EISWRQDSPTIAIPHLSRKFHQSTMQQSQDGSLHPSDGKPLSVQACLDSLRDAFASGAQFVHSLEIRRQSTWASNIWPWASRHRKPKGEAGLLYDDLQAGAEKIQKASDAYDLKLKSIPGPLVSGVWAHITSKRS